MSIWVVRPAELRASDFSRECVAEAYGGISASVIFVEAEPGQGPSLHKHAYAEPFFVVEGQATFIDGTNERAVRGGEVLIVSPDQPHAFVNSGTTPLRQIDVHLNPRFVTEWLDDRG